MNKKKFKIVAQTPKQAKTAKRTSPTDGMFDSYH